MGWDKRELLRKAGDLSQLFFVKDYRYLGGKADGIRAFDVNNGAGLEFTVVADRGLDILSLRYRGINFGYLSKTGLTSPFFADNTEEGFLRNFFAGFLTTCGLSNIGPASEDEGTFYGPHGRMSHTPADEVYAVTDFSSGTPVIRIGGLVRESKLFGENLVLKREISCNAGGKTFFLRDGIENQGFRKEPVMLLYHINFGYPLLDADSTIVLDPVDTIPRTEEAKKGLSTFRELHGPVPGYREQVFYHELSADGEGKVTAGLVNRRLSAGLVMRYDPKTLGTLVQWKQLGEGEYVLGLEPGNSRLAGRAQEKKEGRVEFLEPGEIKKVELEFTVVDGPDGISSAS